MPHTIVNSQVSKNTFNGLLQRCEGNSLAEYINFASHLCHAASNSAGWWHADDGHTVDRNKGELIALMHSELSECLEGVRKDAMDDKLPHRKMEEVELADTVIRILDYAGAFGLDIGGAMIEKIKYNASRADHKPENRSKPDGKKF